MMLLVRIYRSGRRHLHRLVVLKMLKQCLLKKIEQFPNLFIFSSFARSVQRFFLRWEVCSWRMGVGEGGRELGGMGGQRGRLTAGVLLSFKLGKVLEETRYNGYNVNRNAGETESGTNNEGMERKAFWGECLGHPRTQHQIKK